MFDFIKRLFGCRHIYGPVQSDGYQYCKLCGRAIIAPRNEVCNHKWETERIMTTSNAYTGNVIKYTYILKCSRCGEMKTEVIS